MTKFNINTVSAKFDRRSALKGAAALPLLAIPGPAMAHEDETVRCWNARKAAEPAIIEALNRYEAAEDSLPPDYIYNGVTKDRCGMIRTHKQCEIAALAIFGGGVTQEERAANYHAELDDALAKRRAAEIACNLAELERRRDEALLLDDRLEAALMNSKPTTLKGFALKLRAIREYPWDDGVDHLARFNKDLEEFGRAMA